MQFRKLKPEYIVAIIGLIGTILAALIGVLPQVFSNVSAPTVTNTLSATPSPVQIFSKPTSILFPFATPSLSATASLTQVPSKTASLIPSITADITNTPLATEITDSKGVTMRLVPAGEFTMGSDTGGEDDEKPAHTVYLDDFYMDVYEVTNVRYQACVKAGVCAPPASISSDTRENYYGNAEYDNYPVIYVDWNQAKAYCKWRGARLPAEAEWEKAARGTDRRIYPWGNEGIEKRFANYGGSVGDTSEAGAYPDGISPYGLFDMAGNVWEWTSDWYHVYPGGDPQANSIFGKNYRVLRGGSWAFDPYFLRVSDRYGGNPNGRISEDYGFRCVRSSR